MKKSDEHVPFFAEKTRPVRRVSLGELQWRNDSVTVKGGYNVALNESIVFPDRAEDFEVFLQPVSFNSDLCQTHISVLRNGRPSYVSLGCLYRMKGIGAYSQYTCEFGRRLGKMDDDLERVLLLVGNRIRCDKTEEGLFEKRNPATGKVILPRETYVSKYPVIEYDGINTATLAGLFDSRLFKGAGDLALARMGCEWDDGYWPVGDPIGHVYKASIEGIVHIVLEMPEHEGKQTHEANTPTKYDLRRLMDGSEPDTPVVFFSRRPFQHNVIVRPIKMVYPMLDQNSLWFDEDFDREVTLDEDCIIKET